MSIKELVQRYGQEERLTYGILYRLIQKGILRENIHYRKSYRGQRAIYTVNESNLLTYLRTGK